MSLRGALGLLKRLKFFSPVITTATTNQPLSVPKITSSQYGYSDWKMNTGLWVLVSGQTAIFLLVSGNVAFAEDSSVGTENDKEETILSDLRKIDNGSVISNSHTIKWRLFTDKGRELFLQGKIKDAENYFLSALQEAKDGFGQKDPHVASSCNNLAELYRVEKAFDKAEPFYLEAINILEESYGLEDIRVGAALHNLGQFYMVQRKFEDARTAYERSLKIKGRILGYSHTEYSDTMYHLGMVTYLQGMDEDAVALFEGSIRILEEGGQAESVKCLKRLRHLAQIFLKSKKFSEAENVQRRLLNILEVWKGWNSLDTVAAAESLALTLQFGGNLKEAREYLERCLNVRKSLLDENHIQIGGNILHLGSTKILNSNQLRKVDILEARAELTKAKILLNDSVRISRHVLESSDKTRNILQNSTVPKITERDKHAALVILLQSLDAIGLLETAKREIQEPGEALPHVDEAEYAFSQCVAAFKDMVKSRTSKSITSSPEVRAQYLSCLKHLSGVLKESTAERTKSSNRTSVRDLEDEIKRIESQLSFAGKA